MENLNIVEFLCKNCKKVSSNPKVRIFYRDLLLLEYFEFVSKGLDTDKDVYINIYINDDTLKSCFAHGNGFNISRHHSLVVNSDIKIRRIVSEMEIRQSENGEYCVVSIDGESTC